MKINHALPLEYSTEQNDLNIFGFWVFLAAEIMLFATLFTSYFTLEHRVGSADHQGQRSLKLLQY